MKIVFPRQIIQYEIFWNKIFRIFIKPCYKYNVLILTLKNVDWRNAMYLEQFVPDASLEFGIPFAAYVVVMKIT